MAGPGAAVIKFGSLDRVADTQFRLKVTQLIGETAIVIHTNNSNRIRRKL
jgi:hypothetical protein